MKTLRATPHLADQPELLAHFAGCTGYLAQDRIGNAWWLYSKLPDKNLHEGSYFNEVASKPYCFKSPHPPAPLYKVYRIFQGRILHKYSHYTNPVPGFLTPVNDYIQSLE